MLWRPLPVKNAKELVVLATKSKDIDFPVNISYPDFQDYRQLKNIFSDLVCYTPSPVSFGAQGQAERAWVELVTGNYFSALGLQPALGRTFAPDEGWVANKDPLMVLSYQFWQKRFGGNRGIVGQTVQVNNHPFTIIGVAPEDYVGAYSTGSSPIFIYRFPRSVFLIPVRGTPSRIAKPLFFESSATCSPE
jgi:hypothetical protein